MPVLYDSKALIPAPFVSIKKEVQTAGNGNLKVGGTLAITLKGELVSWKGSPNSSGTFWTQPGYPPDEAYDANAGLGRILAKQSALRSLFSNDGRTLEIYGPDGSAPAKFNPQVKGIEFAEDKWVEKCNYVISLAAPAEEDDVDGILDASEEWHIEPTDDKNILFRLTHSVSATGRTRYDSNGNITTPAWQLARSYVLGKRGLGLDTAMMQASGVLDPQGANLVAYNWVRTQQVNEIAGTFQATETWLCFDPQGQPPAFDEYTVNVRVGEDQRSTVTVEGTLTGMEVRNPSSRAVISTKYANALAKFTGYVQPALLSRCQSISGLTLNPIAINTSVGHNQVTGTITYSAEYNNRPTADFAGAVSQNLTINDHNPTDVFASIPVLGRAAGPVLQSIGTVTARKRTISLEVAMPARTQSYTPVKPDSDALLLTFLPAAAVLFTDQDEESWDRDTGRYSRNVSWTWEA